MHWLLLPHYCVLLLCCLILGTVNGTVTNYFVGAGLWDVTGPAAEINMMGYAKTSQNTNGIHLRQYSRAFVIGDNMNQSRVVFVSVDACMITTVVKTAVIQRLKQMFGGQYNESNVCISGIHTHSGAGGFHQYVLYDVTSLGFVKQSYTALVEGIVQSIAKAHRSMVPANMFVNSGELLDANINRSPTAYANNPENEKAKYKHNTDTTMTVVKITDDKDRDVGMMSWFPVHCTSMNNTNGLISSDNKGYASYLFEKDMNPGKLPHDVQFVAAFGQANEGDVSPNTKGPHCLDTGLSCDNPHSTCNGKTENCVAFGPGADMFESTKIIGTKQYSMAKELYAKANLTGMRLSGPVDFRHQYIDMSKTQVPLSDGSKAYTCPPAMGYSFAAGTTDGPGDFDFTQGTNSTNKFWSFVSSFISKPSKQQVACQKPKPILLNTGEVNFPYAWQPKIVPLQLLRIGQFIITGLPGEFSTMSGRRMRNSIKQVLTGAGFSKDAYVVLAGLSNAYTSYITTFEEYQVQRYEGASTIYGPHTLEAYIYKFTKLAFALAKGKPVVPGSSPPDLLSKQLSFVLPVIFDKAPIGSKFGQPVTDAMSSYQQGQEVRVVFTSANPRNNLMTMKTFLAVEQKQTDGTWMTVYTDSHWETKFHWVRTSELLGESQAIVTWDIPSDQPAGTYRIRHSGYHKPPFEEPKPFTGTSREFQVQAKSTNKLLDLYLKHLRERKYNRVLTFSPHSPNH